jgi:hypothetical protein
MDQPAFYVTFGAGQYHGLLANHYFKVYAPDQMKARILVAEGFGVKWSGIYTEKDFEGQVAEYGLICLGTLDEYGNILGRNRDV